MTAVNTDRTEGHFKMFMGCEDADHVKKGVSWIPHSSSAHTHTHTHTKEQYASFPNQQTKQSGK
jgi:hypothetical protein